MVEIYLVGGAIRDHFLGRKTKDYDFVVEAKSYNEMKQWLIDEGFFIYVEAPQHFTIRARRLEPWTFAGIDMTNYTFDFVLARKDGFYSDGRRPDTVEMGTLYDDLARRDFTINAMAMNKDSTLIDPHGGQKDLIDKTIRCVGSTERLNEDALRIFRAIRFDIVLNFKMHPSIWKHIQFEVNDDILAKAHENRIREELEKAFVHNTFRAMELLTHFDHIGKYVFSKTNLWLIPTLKGK
jgi:tRNA nucleotidyltransferase (CCA-adding enzyme)